MPMSVPNTGHGTGTLPVDLRNGVLSLFHNFPTMNTVFLTANTFPLNFQQEYFTVSQIILKV